MNYTRLTKPRKPPRMNLRVSEIVRCPSHLKWLRGRPCCVQDADFGPGAIVCSGKMEAHHVRHGNHAGVGIKSGDDTAVAVCSGHHRQYHDQGHDTFERIYKVRLADIAAAMWKLSPHRTKYEAAHPLEKD